MAANLVLVNSFLLTCMQLWNESAYGDNSFLWHSEHRRRGQCTWWARSTKFCFYEYIWLQFYLHKGLYFMWIPAGLNWPAGMQQWPICASIWSLCRATRTRVWRTRLQKCVLMRSCWGRSSLCTLSPAPLCGSAKQSLSHQAEPLRILHNQLTQQHQHAGVTHSYKDQSRGWSLQTSQG